MAAGTLIAQDTFAGRTVTGGWGTASDGNTWTDQSGSASDLSVSANEGRLNGSASTSFLYMTLGTATASNVDLVARYTTGDVKNDEGHVLFDFSSTSTYYLAGIDAPNSAPVINIFKANGGGEVQEASTAFSATNGTAYWERIHVTTSGSSATIQVRAWKDGTAEPTSWNLTWTDTAALAAGKVGINGWDDVNGWGMDHFSAGNLSSGSPAAFLASLPHSVQDAVDLFVLGWLVAAAYLLIPRIRLAGGGRVAPPRYRVSLPRAGRGALRSRRGRRSL